jgi:hypothetical protein
MNMISLIIVNLILDTLVAGVALINRLIIHTEDDIFPRLNTVYVAFKPIV